MSNTLVFHSRIDCSSKSISASGTGTGTGTGTGRIS